MIRFIKNSFVFVLAFSMLTCGGDDTTTPSDTDLGEITVHGTIADSEDNIAMLLITNENVDEVLSAYIDLDESNEIERIRSIFFVDTASEEFQKLSYNENNLPSELYDSESGNTFEFSDITASGTNVRVMNSEGDEIDSYTYSFDDFNTFQNATLFQTLPFTSPPLTGLDPTYELQNALKVNLTEGQIRAAKSAAYGVAVGLGVFGCGAAAAASAGAAAVACAGLAVTILSGPCSIDCGAPEGFCDALNVAGLGFTGNGCVGDVLETVVGNKGAIVECMTNVGVSAVGTFEPADNPGDGGGGGTGFSFEEEDECGGSSARIFSVQEENLFRALGW